MPDLVRFVMVEDLATGTPSRVLGGISSAMASPLLRAKQSQPLITRWLSLACCLVLLLALTACAKGSNELYGWTALQPEMDLKAEPDGGPNGEPVFALLYTLVPGKDYTIEHPMPIAGLEGRPSLRLTAKATRVLYLAVVLLDRDENQYECARILQAGEWRTLEFDAFEPAVDDWSQIMAIRFVDRTALLVSQGPVSLKLVGLPQ